MTVKSIQEHQLRDRLLTIDSYLMDFERPTLCVDTYILSNVTSDRVTFLFNLFSINKLYA